MTRANFKNLDRVFDEWEFGELPPDLVSGLRQLLTANLQIVLQRIDVVLVGTTLVICAYEGDEAGDAFEAPTATAEVSLLELIRTSDPYITDVQDYLELQNAVETKLRSLDP